MNIKYIFYNTAEKCLKQIKEFIKNTFDYDVVSLTALFLGDKYSDFIEDIYKEGWIPQEDLIMKQNFVQNDGRHLHAYIFEVAIPNITEEYNERKGRKVFVEVEALKKALRENFKRNIPNYFHDILVHSPDCEQEKEYIDSLIDSYKVNTKYKMKNYILSEKSENVR